MSVARNFLRGFFPVCLLALSLALTACGGKTTAPTVAANPLEGASTQNLAYGISLKIPQGWTVVSSTQPGQPTNEALLAKVKREKRINLLHMVFNNSQGAPVAQGIGYFVSSTDVFMPQQLAANASEQDFVRLGEAIMQNEREVAAKENTQSPMLEWKVARTNIGGHLAIMQTGLGKMPEGGTMRLLNHDVYLPGNVGFMLVLKGQTDEPGIEDTMRAISTSIQIAQ